MLVEPNYCRQLLLIVYDLVYLAICILKLAEFINKICAEEVEEISFLSRHQID